jgi:hypothetical protein
MKVTIKTFTLLQSKDLSSVPRVFSTQRLSKSIILVINSTLIKISFLEFQGLIMSKLIGQELLIGS